MLVLTFYLMLDWNKVQQRLIDIFPEDYRNDIRQIRDEISAVWQSYFRGQLVLMFTIGMLTGIGLALIGMPMAALFGLLAGALDLIPNLGPTITFVLATMGAYFSGSTYLPISNLLFLFITIALIEIIQMMENFFLQPYIVGRWMKIHPGIVFVSVVGALTLGSALVALIIVPSIVSLAIIFRYIRCMLMDIDPYPIEAESRVVEKPEKIP
jgi:predicted PurR-regulated permease PerM